MQKLVLLVVMVVVAVGGWAGPVSAGGSTIYTTPETVLYAYFNALNRGDYATAYIYTDRHEDLFSFVAGFEDTQRIDPYFGVQQTDRVSVRMPAVLVSYNRNITTTVYAGCIHLQAGVVAGVSSYQITGNSLQQVFIATEPDLSAISDYVNTVPCYGNVAGHPQPITGGPLTTPEYMLRNYFAAINTQNYDAAYRFWLYPLPFADPDGAPSTDYRPDFNTFATGYAETATINVYTHRYVETGAAAGKGYLNGVLPVVLVDERTTGEMSTYAGCFVIGFHQDGRYGIVNGSFSLIEPRIPPTAQSIEATLRGLDCVSLGIPN